VAITLLLKVFTQRNFAADCLQQNLNFTDINDKSRLCHPLGELRVTYVVHLWLVRKRVVDFPLVLIEHFSLALTVEAL